MEEREDVLQELAELAELLATVPHHDYEQRARLMAQRTELRERATALWGSAGRDREETEAQLRRLEAIRDDLVKHGHVNPAAFSGGGAGGGFGFTADAWELNRRIDASQDRDALEKRIANLRAELAGTTERGKERGDSG